MEVYIGAKIIQAEPMEKNGRQGYKVVYPPSAVGMEPYTSWSPKEVFEIAYRKVTEAESDVL